MVKDFNQNLNNIPKELKLILELLNMNDDRNDSSSTNLSTKDIDWHLFIELAMHHRIYPSLYKKIKGISKEIIPEKVIKILCNKYKANTFQMLYLSGEMESIGKLLLENSVDALFLKGPILAVELYGDISMRTSCDLDAIVSINDLNKVHNLLMGCGYVKEDYIQTVLNDWKWRHHHLTYFHSTKNIKIEIHWRLNPGPGAEPSFSEMWKRRQLCHMSNVPIYYLGEEDLFFFLVSHGARHGWSRLRWLLDIHHIIEKNPNWSLIIRALKKYHALHVGGQAVLLATSLFKSTKSLELKPLTSGNRPVELAIEAIYYLENMVNLHTDPVPDSVAAYHRNHLVSLMSLQQKVLYIISTLHPYYTDVETLPLPKYLHFLYFPLRPFLCIWRKTRKHALP
jgi:hypothetical protein